MGSLSTLDVIDRLAELGCAVRVEGEKLKVRGPDVPEVAEMVRELRARRDEAIAMLREAESTPPSLEEVTAALPSGVRLVSYQPKRSPFAVAPVSVVTDAGRFYRAYLRDLRERLKRPGGYPPLADIVGKLADAGLELEIEQGVGARRPTSEFVSCWKTQVLFRLAMNVGSGNAQSVAGPP